MKTSDVSVVILEDENFYGIVLKDYLSKNGFENTELIKDESEFVSYLTSNPDFVLMDHRLSKNIGIELKRIVNTLSPDTEIIYTKGKTSLNQAMSDFKSRNRKPLLKDDVYLGDLLKKMDQRISTKLNETIQQEELQYEWN